MQLQLIDKKGETADVVSFIFKPSSPVSWKAGQFLELSVPHENPDDHGTKHYFTIASAPCEERMQVTTRLTGSTFKKTLHSLPLGAMLYSEAPDGDFTLDNPDQDYVFIAGGIGITPFRSIFKQLRCEGKSLKSGVLLYGNRSADAVFSQELNALGEELGYDIKHVLPPEKLDADTICKYVPDIRQRITYLSGPEPMVEALEKELLALGVQEEQFKRDYFPGYDQSNY